MNRLNVRLLMAFGVVLAITLAIMWLTMLIVLRLRPVNTDSETLDLAVTLIEVREGVLEFLTGRDRPDGFTAEEQRRLQAYFEEQAAAHNIRIIVLQDPDCVIWDTGGPFPRSQRDAITREEFFRTRRPDTAMFQGQFEDVADQSTWLYVGASFLPALANAQRQARDFCGAAPRGGNISLLAADLFPEQTFQTILEDYEGSGLLLALVQAVVTGMFFALIASLLIVRWIAKPLQSLTRAASQLAHGNYATRAPVRGPSEVRVVANAFNVMAQRVELTQQAQQDFLANVSHDLRTPLTSIQGFAQAIVEGVTDTEASQRAAGVIYNEAGRLTRMVNELLDLARIQAGRMDMMRQAVELDEILLAVGQSLEMKAKENDVTIHLKIPCLPRIAGDGDRLAQVFTNLVDNAIKHTPDGGQVWLKAQLDSQGGLLIQIEDTGEGIPKTDLPRVFERFYQVDKSRAKRVGTGLGLAIAQEIIYAHGGRIWAESEYGQGARFNVWLPQPTHDTRETVIFRRN